jgi:hypothetical protein
MITVQHQITKNRQIHPTNKIQRDIRKTAPTTISFINQSQRTVIRQRAINLRNDVSARNRNKR